MRVCECVHECVSVHVCVCDEETTLYIPAQCQDSAVI